VTAAQGSGTTTIPGHTMVTVGGGADEASQIIVSGPNVINVTNPSLFTSAPILLPSTTGPAKFDLRFTPAANATGTSVVTVRAQDSGGTANGGDDTAQTTFTITIGQGTQATVVDRHIFYKDSAYDSSPGALSFLDDTAIDTSKDALLPGQTATFVNTTGFSRGINGFMIDVMNLANPSAAALANDISLRTGNSNNTSTWTPVSANVIQGMDVRQIGANLHRITVGLTDGAVKNTWLEVRLAASSDTGLAAPSVHYSRRRTR
jgi:hypothetical protein